MADSSASCFIAKFQDSMQRYTFPSWYLLPGINNLRDSCSQTSDVNIPVRSSRFGIVVSYLLSSLEINLLSAFDPGRYNVCGHFRVTCDWLIVVGSTPGCLSVFAFLNNRTQDNVISFESRLPRIRFMGVVVTLSTKSIVGFAIHSSNVLDILK